MNQFLKFFAICYALSLCNASNSDEEVAQYIRDAIENFRGRMTEGIPEYNISVLEPFELNHPLNIHKKDESIEISVSIPSGIVVGLSNFTLKDLSVNVGLIKAKFTFEFENLRNEGYYDLEGLVYEIFPVFGNGSYWLQAKTVIATLDIDLQVTIQFTLCVQDIRLTFRAMDVEGHFENLIEGGDIGDILNHILNTVGVDVLNKHLPDIFEKVTEALKIKLDEELKKHPITDFMPTSPRSV